eukprot:CAMPEP_0119341382 /NCGR_PEP_ID=MMETSP1333-20130426/102275_1 /TAXON_ID=418940 /ORGANISM="Scyphosphaera apsteinii, Strain RCC1455" /LENGTH=80 /DNA_ID=CAMNT_0007353331 /DNA_START=261 /DNA_END=503 /DNA_ORIENTATION=+
MCPEHVVDLKIAFSPGTRACHVVKRAGHGVPIERLSPNPFPLCMRTQPVDETPAQSLSRRPMKPKGSNLAPIAGGITRCK